MAGQLIRALGRWAMPLTGRGFASPSPPANSASEARYCRKEARPSARATLALNRVTMHDLATAALLPAGLMDVLPPFAAYEARTVERLMAHLAGYGYERVKPPLIEFEETLLAGSGAALAAETFRLMDPMSRRMLALRPDMTMQVARIASSRLAHWPRPLRLGYAGRCCACAARSVRSGSSVRSARRS